MINRRFLIILAQLVCLQALLLNAQFWPLQQRQEEVTTTTTLTTKTTTKAPVTVLRTLRRTNQNEKFPINILLLLPVNDTYKFSLNKVLAALQLAIDDLKSADYGSRFKIDIVSDSCDCTAIKAPINAMENIFGKRNHTRQFQAVFGPMCDYSLAPIARYAPFWNVAILTVGAMAQDFRKNKFTEYKTLTNVGVTMYWLDKFMISLFRRFGWRQVIFFFDKDYQEQTTNFNCYLTMASLKAALLNSQISVDYKIREKQDKRPIETLLIDYVGNRFSVVMLCGSTDFVHDTMNAAYKMGFMNGEYTFINIDIYAQMHTEDRLVRPWKLISNSPINNKKNKSNTTMDDIKAYQGLMTVTLKIDDYNGRYHDFQKRLINFSNMFKNETEVNYFLASFYDAMKIYIKALDRTVRNNDSVNNINAVLKHIWSKEFEGVTGKVVIDSYGERMGVFDLHDLNPNTLEFEPVISSKIYNNTDIVLDYDENKRPIYWEGLKHGSFPDSPKCGYNRAKCPVKEKMPFWMWILISMLIIMLIMVAISAVFYRKTKFEAELNAMNWLIKWEDVSASMASDERKLSISKRVKGVKKKSLLNHFTLEKNDETISLGSTDLINVDSKAVVYKRNWCHIKKINKSKIEITRLLLLEVKKIKDLQNDHITRFIGICLEPNRQFIFTEYCQKGSLKDILENEQIELETEFKYHLIHDIIKGMVFLHSSELKCHGNLNSSNCVVDSRFTVKITDFGLPMIRTKIYKNEEHFYQCQLWVAPELHTRSYLYANNTSSSSSNNPMGTPKGDVYSFAVIAQEILYRRGVFYLTEEDREAVYPIIDSINSATSRSSNDSSSKSRSASQKNHNNGIVAPPMSPTEYDDYDNYPVSIAAVAAAVAAQAQDVAQPRRRKITSRELVEGVKRGIRPSIDPSVCCREIADLLKKCWTELVYERPDFTVIRDVMRKSTKISGNILDNLLARMEKYANNLEDLVKERTEACENERKRAEALLYRLLPPTVAAKLMSGNELIAESFNSVTIYFSDICGFTNLSAQSTPMQVVHLLNGLYTLFDSIIEGFDVYKVETIGDAYMVVSGLPQPNQNHAQEIARMSLALLENVKNFRIPHLPEQPLRLRIGLHTGPCVAGVVGLKMPRYCLFGDTVNTASRMESNGAPLRIHVSPQLKQELDKFCSFNLLLRGQVEMKGKGVMTTYWLLGENGRIIDTTADLPRMNDD